MKLSFNAATKAAKSLGSRMMKAGKRVGKLAERCVVPKNSKVGAGAAAAGWYAGRMGLAYAPAMLNQACVNGTCAVMGNNLAARVVAYTLVAPAVTPALTPVVASVATVAAGVLMTAAGNYAYDYFTAKETSPQRPEMVVDAVGQLHPRSERVAAAAA